MEPLRGLERASSPPLMADKSLTKEAIKNLKRNKHKSDKHYAKSSAPKLAPSLTLELAKTTLRRASQQRSSFMAYPLMVTPLNPMLAPCPRQVPSWRGTLTREAPVTRGTIQPRLARILNLPQRQARVPSLGPTQT